MPHNAMTWTTRVNGWDLPRFRSEPREKGVRPTLTKQEQARVRFASSCKVHLMFSFSNLRYDTYRKLL